MVSTKEKIARLALERFNEAGVAAVGVRQLARELNISPGNFSYHFPRKEDLLKYLLQAMMKSNDQAFGMYYKLRKPGLSDFMELLRSLLRNVYQVRAIMVDFQSLNAVLAEPGMNYKKQEKSRHSEYRKIFLQLNEMDDLRLDSDQLNLLVSFMSLFGRFWIAEAFLSFRNSKEEEVIQYYLQFACRQFNAFATAKGRISLKRFRLKYKLL